MAIALQIPEREFHFTDADFRFLGELVTEQTGIVLADHKRDMVYGRLARRLRILGLSRFEDYCSLLQGQSGGEEMTHLINAVTTNLTSFFREQHHFEHLRDHVILPMKERAGVKKLRLWSAACSAGMEPYSMAMTLMAAAGSFTGWDAKILATDIDSNMIETGIGGTYAAAEYEKIPLPYRSYALCGNDGKVRVHDGLKPLVAFRQLNLLESWPMKGPFDAIFCRNVVIYFDKPTKQKLFARMAEMLAPGGFLYIGHSETLHGISDRFKPVGRTTYQRIK
jgi:chemotaxis protein methyltransferase CheR